MHIDKYIYMLIYTLNSFNKKHFLFRPDLDFLFFSLFSSSRFIAGDALFDPRRRAFRPSATRFSTFGDALFDPRRRVFHVSTSRRAFRRFSTSGDAIFNVRRRDFRRPATCFSINFEVQQRDFRLDFLICQGFGETLISYSMIS